MEPGTIEPIWRSKWKGKGSYNDINYYRLCSTECSKYTVIYSMAEKEDGEHQWLTRGRMLFEILIFFLSISFTTLTSIRLISVKVY